MINAAIALCLPLRFNIGTPQVKDKCELCVGDGGGFPLGLRRGTAPSVHPAASGPRMSWIRDDGLRRRCGAPEQAWRRRQACSNTRPTSATLRLPPGGSRYLRCGDRTGRGPFARASLSLLPDDQYRRIRRAQKPCSWRASGSAPRQRGAIGRARAPPSSAERRGARGHGRGSLRAHQAPVGCGHRDGAGGGARGRRRRPVVPAAPPALHRGTDDADPPRWQRPRPAVAERRRGGGDGGRGRGPGAGSGLPSRPCRRAGERADGLRRPAGPPVGVRCRRAVHRRATGSGRGLSGGNGARGVGGRRRRR